MKNKSNTIFMGLILSLMSASTHAGEGSLLLLEKNLATAAILQEKIKQEKKQPEERLQTQSKPLTK